MIFPKVPKLNASALGNGAAVMAGRQTRKRRSETDAMRLRSLDS